MQGGVGSGGAVELEVHHILHQPAGGGRDHGLNVGVDPLLAVLRSELPVLVQHLWAPGQHPASLQPHGRVTVGGQDVPQLLHMFVVHVADQRGGHVDSEEGHVVVLLGEGQVVRGRGPLHGAGQHGHVEEVVREVEPHGSDGGDEVPGEDRGEVPGGQADVALLEVGVDPGLGAGEGLVGELREGSAGMGPGGAGTHGTQLAAGVLLVTLALEHTCGTSGQRVLDYVLC